MSPPRIQLHHHSTPASFDVLIDDVAWFSTGQPASFRSGGAFHSALLGLVLNATVASRGYDSLGAFQQTTWKFEGADGVHFEPSVRLYDHAIAFKQTFPDGAHGTSAHNVDGLISSFPSFALPPAGTNDGRAGDLPRRGYLQYQGDMMGAAFETGQWDTSAQGVGSGINGTGPLCIFDEMLSTSVVISASANFMAASQTVELGHGLAKSKSLSFGLMGNVTSLLPGASVEFIMVVASGGITKAMIAWGDVLLARYGRERSTAWARDITLQRLGYSTDNGADYYYNNLEGHCNHTDCPMEQTILDIHAYAQRERIPYSYWLADSWWYYQDPTNGGVTRWSARPDVFPHGLEYIWKQTGWMVQGHNRYWSAHTYYAKDYGGLYAFMTDPNATYAYALPYSQSFWDDLFQNASSWGLHVYEQDWLDRQTDRFRPLTQSATLGREWLMMMGSAAAKFGLSIQYCMAYCRHILQALEIPAVTQARASPDYHPGNTQWQPIGTTALLGWALGIAPSKDNFWSTVSQPQPNYVHPREPNSRLQSVVLALSKGPVAASDAVNRSNVDLILRTCTADGRLLQPGRPATKLDAMLLADALRDGRPRGELWFADTTLVVGAPHWRFGVLLAANLSHATRVTPLELGYTESVSELVAVEANVSNRVVRIPGNTGLLLSPSDSLNFTLWNLAPVAANGWALLGEVSTKHVGVSLARFSDVRETGALMSVRVHGAPGEVVSVSFVPPSETTTVVVQCKIRMSGSATACVPAIVCT